MNRHTVALVTSGEFRSDDDDLPILLDALGKSGIRGVLADWDGEVSWSEFDLALIRSPWNYTENAGAFQQWLDAASVDTLLRNDAATCRWNMDKAYLGELARRGAPVVPTTYCATPAEVDAALCAVTSPRVVVKPSLSAGSRRTGLFEKGDPSVSSLAYGILRDGRTVMVQPAIDSVESAGEHGLIFVGGTFSHAVAKGPILKNGGGFLEGGYRENIEAYDPVSAELEAARTVLDAISLCRPAGSAPLLYARLDFVHGDEPLLLEAELLEPSLFLSTCPSAAERVVSACRVEVERAGRSRS